MRKLILGAFVCAMLVVGQLALAVDASADAITFWHEGTGSFSGTIDGTSFTADEFLITAYGDTDDRDTYGDGYFIDHTSAEIWIEGVGTYDFTTDTRTFYNTSNDTVGFSRAGSSGADLFNGPTSLPDWGMLTSYGPYSGTASTLQWSSPSVVTTDGVLVFTSTTGTGVFEAAVVPEPATLALFGLGAAGLALRRRKRKLA